MTGTIEASARPKSFHELVLLIEPCSAQFKKEPYAPHFRGVGVGPESLRVCFNETLPTDASLPTEYKGVPLEFVSLGIYGAPKSMKPR